MKNRAKSVVRLEIANNQFIEEDFNHADITRILRWASKCICFTHGCNNKHQNEARYDSETAHWIIHAHNESYNLNISVIGAV